MKEENKQDNTTTAAPLGAGGNTAKYLREKRGVSEQAKENLKEFNRVKKLITEALADGELTVAQISAKINMSVPDTLYHLMSLVKYGVAKVGAIDDMDEYFTYKLNK